MNVVQIFRFTALFVYNIRKDRLIFETFRVMSRKQGNSDVELMDEKKDLPEGFYKNKIS